MLVFVHKVLTDNSSFIHGPLCTLPPRLLTEKRNTKARKENPKDDENEEDSSKRKEPAEQLQTFHRYLALLEIDEVMDWKRKTTRSLDKHILFFLVNCNNFLAFFVEKKNSLYAIFLTRFKDKLTGK